MSERPSRTLAAARRVAAVASEVGIDTAVIGAVALAVHGYPRATRDVDLACATDPTSKLRDLQRRIAAEGFTAELFEPDAVDPLGGVLTVTGDACDPIQVVNFHNPLAPTRNPGAAAIRSAVLNRELGLRVVGLEHLVALKLYAGGPKSRSDVVELLAHNPGASHERIREVCAAFGLDEEWTRLVGELGDRRPS